MFEQFFRKIQAFLRNDRPYDEWFNGSTSHTRKWHPELFDEEPKPWYTSVYWFLWRNGKRLRDFPSDSYYNLKYAHQRLTRGWDDRAVWSIDHWLDDKMPAMLRQLKADKHGTPMSMFEAVDLDADGNPTEEGHQRADARWEATLDKMIAAFEAHARMEEGLYEEELGRYPLRRAAGVSRDAFDKLSDARFEASRKLQERDQKIWEEGAGEFVAHYSSLWD